MLLYIDTNAYLEYFRKNAKERLTPLQELVKLVGNNLVTLLIPTQTKQEYVRHRRHTAEEMRHALIENSEINFPLPATLGKETKEIRSVKKNEWQLKKAYKRLLKKYDDAIEKENTDADVLIKKLFSEGQILKDTEEIVRRAYLRYMRNNPPRKQDHHYGDAIIWETILDQAKNDNLFVVSKDGDFAEVSKEEFVFSRFLENEWREKKKGKKTKLFRSLGEFVNHADKKKPIKKEIIQEEQKTVFASGVITMDGILNTALPGYGGFSALTSDIINRPFQNPVLSAMPSVNTYGILDGPFAPLGASYNRGPSFCPHCGSGHITSLLGGYRCSSCLRDFKIY